MRLVAGLHPDPLEEVTALPRTLIDGLIGREGQRGGKWERGGGGREGKGKEGEKEREGLKCVDAHALALMIRRQE